MQRLPPPKDKEELSGDDDGGIFEITSKNRQMTRNDAGRGDTGQGQQSEVQGSLNLGGILNFFENMENPAKAREEQQQKCPWSGCSSRTRTIKKHVQEYHLKKEVQKIGGMPPSIEGKAQLIREWAGCCMDYLKQTKQILCGDCGKTYTVTKKMLDNPGKNMGHRKSVKNKGQKRVEDCQKCTLEEAKQLNGWATFLFEDPDEWTSTEELMAVKNRKVQLRMKDYTVPIRAGRKPPGDNEEERTAGSLTRNLILLVFVRS
jgi:hypothetical protein